MKPASFPCYFGAFGRIAGLSDGGFLKPSKVLLGGHYGEDTAGKTGRLLHVAAHAASSNRSDPGHAPDGASGGVPISWKTIMPV
jgi:hypothetical protein